MARRDRSATVALCASLMMHGVLAAALIWVWVSQMDEVKWWPALGGRLADEDPIVMPDRKFGESGGKGEAANALVMESELFAGRLGTQDQAPLSRDPIGNGEVPDAPGSMLAERVKVVEVPQSIQTPASADAPFGVGAVAMAGPVVKARPPVQVEENIAAVSMARGSAGAVAGDPAPESESESDAFSRMGNVRVRNGKVEARLGRDFKSVRPRLSMKGELDAMSVRRPVVDMKVYLDETGKVIDVKILRSSGSNEIDLPTTSAMYKWWIEPARDKEGKAIRDVVLVRFSYL
jgi:TonB family protein